MKKISFKNLDNLGIAKVSKEDLKKIQGGERDCGPFAHFNGLQCVCNAGYIMDRFGNCRVHNNDVCPATQCYSGSNHGSCITNSITNSNGTLSWCECDIPGGQGCN